MVDKHEAIYGPVPDRSIFDGEIVVPEHLRNANLSLRSTRSYGGFLGSLSRSRTFLTLPTSQSQNNFRGSAPDLSRSVPSTPNIRHKKHFSSISVESVLEESPQHATGSSGGCAGSHTPRPNGGTAGGNSTGGCLNLNTKNVKKIKEKSSIKYIFPNDGDNVNDIRRKSEGSALLSAAQKRMSQNNLRHRSSIPIPVATPQIPPPPPPPPLPPNSLATMANKKIIVNHSRHKSESLIDRSNKQPMRTAPQHPLLKNNTNNNNHGHNGSNNHGLAASSSFAIKRPLLINKNPSVRGLSQSKSLHNIHEASSSAAATPSSGKQNTVNIIPPPPRVRQSKWGPIRGSNSFAENLSINSLSTYTIPRVSLMPNYDQKIILKNDARLSDGIEKRKILERNGYHHDSAA